MGFMGQRSNSCFIIMQPFHSFSVFGSNYDIVWLVSVYMGDQNRKSIKAACFQALTKDLTQINGCF